jgi:uncharacterized protein YuzE
MNIFNYCKESDCAYIRVNSGKVDRTEELSPNILVDFDAENRILGVEILRLKKLINKK